MNASLSEARRKIVLMVGLPGSGKTTWLSERGIPAISSDAVRELLTDDITNQSKQKEVFETVRYLIAQRLKIGRAISYVDATSLTRKDRAPYIVLAREYACDIEAVFLDVALEECLRRNLLRARQVPEAVIRAMAAKLERPGLEEGFCAVVPGHCVVP